MAPSHSTCPRPSILNPSDYVSSSVQDPSFTPSPKTAAKHICLFFLQVPSRKLEEITCLRERQSPSGLVTQCKVARRSSDNFPVPDLLQHLDFRPQRAPSRHAFVFQVGDVLESRVKGSYRMPYASATGTQNMDESEMKQAQTNLSHGQLLETRGIA
ncbi:hypothetical protein Anapl_07651 [Anas platyrhynchos]|uniref:Uncharacterized protein n=1 Tax=Anas platyrhynchos TaxID=8839 RepID=R0KBR1_ANAPL|nr:hypothetical protein Anapl_07651 [Anas platyrhynchos]